MYFIGIDIGTSSICGVAYCPATGESASITKENHATITAHDTWDKKQDPDIIIGIVSDIIADFRSRFSDISGIGFSGQMHGIVYTDIRGNAVSPLYTWQDGRGNLDFKDGTSYVDSLKALSGYPLATGYGLVTHFYNLKNGLIPDNAAKLCTIMDYAVMRLTGRTTPLIDPSNAAALGLFDKRQLAFDRTAVSKAGMDTDILPEVATSVSAAGYFEGIPVYTAIGDNQASFLGSVRDKEHSIQITVGTSSQISIYSKEYLEVPSLDTRPLPGGGYLLVGAALCGGYSYALLKNFFKDTVCLFTDREPSDADLYRIMTATPYQVPTPESLTAETLFLGTRENPGKRGSIANISASNLTPQNLILAFVQGVCSELYDFFELLPETLKQDKTILVGSGNGLKRNNLLRKALEGRFARPLQLSDVQEEAAFGACVNLND